MDLKYWKNIENWNKNSTTEPIIYNKDTENHETVNGKPRDTCIAFIQNGEHWVGIPTNYPTQRYTGKLGLEVFDESTV